MNTATAAASEIDLAPGARQMPRRRVLLPCAVELSSVEERQRRAVGRRAWMGVAGVNAARLSTYKDGEMHAQLQGFIYPAHAPVQRQVAKRTSRCNRLLLDGALT
jgi:hypothetical protein